VLPANLRLGEPKAIGALVAYPVFGAPGRATYALLSEALSRGAALHEVVPPNVNRLRMDAPPDLRVLLFAGEEVIGAKQNRIVNATVVIGASESAEIPVSCIEHGRWSRDKERDGFESSSQVAFTSLRTTLNEMVSESRVRGRSYESDQGRVWRDVATTMDDHDIRSNTGAMTDVFEGKRALIDSLVCAVRAHEGQLGLLAFVGGRFLALDLVSSPTAWAALHPRIVSGHALEALRVAPGMPTPFAAAAAVLTRVSTLPTATAAAPEGIGRELRADGAGMKGAGVLLDGELVQLSVFPQAA
jgi:hypothetical protein